MSEYTVAEAHPPALTTVNDFETWVSQNWLYPRGSHEALVHVSGKLQEEVQEFAEAIAQGDPTAIRFEGGDVLWTATAVAINEGPGIGPALRHSSWHKVIPEGELTVASIDQLAQRRWTRARWDRADGFVQTDLNGSRREIHTAVRKGDTAATCRVLGQLAGQLCQSANNLYVLEHMTQLDVSEVTAADSPCAWIDIAYVHEALSQIVITCSSVARNQLGTGLADMMEANRYKLQHRLAQGKPITTPPSAD